jgi:hypothetical protein
MDDPALNLEAQRLFLSAALTTHVLRRIGGRVPSDTRDLLVLSRSIDADHVERTHHLSFEPSYPGVTAGTEAARNGGLRLVLACRAFDREGTALGVVFTTLIPGRLPQVSVAPAVTPIPAGWRPPGKSS